MVKVWYKDRDISLYQIYTAWWQLTPQDINPIAYAPEFTLTSLRAHAHVRTQTTASAECRNILLVSLLIYNILPFCVL